MEVIIAALVAATTLAPAPVNAVPEVENEVVAQVEVERDADTDGRAIELTESRDPLAGI